MRNVCISGGAKWVTLVKEREGILITSRGKRRKMWCVLFEFAFSSLMAEVCLESNVLRAPWSNVDVRKSSTCFNC